MNKAINQYLSKYAESEIDLSASINQSYKNVLILPVCFEEFDHLDSVLKNNLESSLLVIIVINSPDSHEKSQAWQRHNHHHLEFYKNKFKCKVLSDQQDFIFSCNPGIDCLVLDRNSQNQQLPIKQGVGLARKIAADLALKLFSDNKIHEPWIYSTDADVVLPENYFEVINQKEDVSAFVNEFKHIGSDIELNRKQNLYDFKLRYYQAGIRYAESKYDYIPLGSTLVVSMLNYAGVRGFPKRSAGEDFYLLNKLNKTADVVINTKKVVKIKTRYSDRVPFGTGPAVANMDLNPKFYHPKVFILLRQWVEHLKGLWTEEGLTISQPQIKELKELFSEWNCQNEFEKSKPQITNQDRWEQFLHQWMDAFRCLKAVHFFEKFHHRIPLQKLLNHHDFDKFKAVELIKLLDTYEQT